jgi:hypothetical protein
MLVATRLKGNVMYKRIIIAIVFIYSGICYSQGNIPRPAYKTPDTTKREIDRIGTEIAKIENHKDPDSILKMLGLYPISKDCKKMIIQVDDKTKRYFFIFDGCELSIEYRKLLNENLKLEKISIGDERLEKPLYEKILK